MPVDKVAVGAGGNTLLEMRFVLNTGAVFPSGTTADINTYYIYVTHYTPQTLITTICDEKNNEIKKGLY